MIGIGNFSRLNPVTGKQDEFYWFTTSIPVKNWLKHRLIIEMILKYIISQLVGDNANKVCESTIGGKAASLENVVKNTAAKRYLDSHSKSLVRDGRNWFIFWYFCTPEILTAWTSGNDFQENGKFVWMKNPGPDVPFTYIDFHKDPAFPNPDCHCVSIEAIKGPGCGNDCNGQYRWRERPCFEKKQLLCELA